MREIQGDPNDQDWFQEMDGDKTSSKVDLNMVWSSVYIIIEECHQLWCPWQWALIVKLLGKNVSLKVQEP